MPRIVMKFGGTSVADLERIRNVARRIKAEVERGNEVVVTISAMAGTTNKLVDYVQDEHLLPLHGLTALKKLEIVPFAFGRTPTRTAVSRLRQALPGLEVIRGAYR